MNIFRLHQQAENLSLVFRVSKTNDETNHG
jgi:hypothetical protein